MHNLSHAGWARRSVVFALGTTALASAQISSDYAIQLGVTAREDPRAIVLTWPESVVQPTNDYLIYRRTSDSDKWGEPIGDGSAVGLHEGNIRSVTDGTVEAGRFYEYKIVKRLNATTVTGQHHMAYGYAWTGIRAPLLEHRGTIVLVVEQSIAVPLSAELQRLQNDLIGDGWRVVRQEVGRHDAVTDVKARIKEVYESDPKNVRAVFLLGRVPVPYSGNFQPRPPDGHAAPGDDHRGAWPADVYYADMDGAWTDTTEHFINTSNARGSNVPGDGKFDQSYLPSDVELQLGRVDLSSLPGANGKQSLPEEVELLRAYLNKNHEFRHGRSTVSYRALIADSGDPSGGRAYAASAYRSLAPLLGARNFTIVNTDLSTPREDRWLSRLVNDTYLWTFGSGGGSNTTISGLADRGAYNDVWAADLVDLEAKGVFHLFFGSWLGDWDQPDNLMRTTLVTKHGLAAAWSGRPHLVFHPLGIGETLGYCIRASQNNDETYHNQVNTFRRGIHVALMGDPTLRLYAVAPPTDVRGNLRGSDVVLGWKPPQREALGFYVYRSNGDGQTFTRITESPVTEASYTDVGRAGEGAVYMIRTVVLETTPSGTFFNASQGVFIRPTAADAEE